MAKFSGYKISCVTTAWMGSCWCGDTQGSQIANTIWLDFDNAPAVSKGRRVDKALTRFMELERKGDVKTKEYKSLADFEIAESCY